MCCTIHGILKEDNYLKLGFIGGGNMAFAMLKGVFGQNLLDKEHVIVSDASEEACLRLR